TGGKPAVHRGIRGGGGTRRRSGSPYRRTIQLPTCIATMHRGTIEAVAWPRPRLFVESFVGPRIRLLAQVLIVGLVGGLVGAAYVGTMKLFQRGLWPTHWSTTAHLGILVAVGIAVALLIRLLGSPGDV